jgi:hypothetical protein
LIVDFVDTAGEELPCLASGPSLQFTTFKTNFHFSSPIFKRHIGCAAIGNRLEMENGYGYRNLVMVLISEAEELPP